MSNWDHVLPYDSQAAEWLAGKGLPHPPVAPGNRLPTQAEVSKAMAALGFTRDSPIHVEYEDDDADSGAFTVRGDLILELRLLQLLGKSCGQLWLYPDTGDPAIIVDARISPELTDAAYQRALRTEDPWACFHRAAYSDARGGTSPSA